MLRSCVLDSVSVKNPADWSCPEGSSEAVSCVSFWVCDCTCPQDAELLQTLLLGLMYRLNSLALGIPGLRARVQPPVGLHSQGYGKTWESGDAKEGQSFRKSWC